MAYNSQKRHERYVKYEKEKRNTPEYKQKRHEYYLKAKSAGKIKKVDVADAKAYRSAHLEEMRQAQRNYYARHREKVLARVKEYDATHKEQRRAASKLRRAKKKQQEKE